MTETIRVAEEYGAERAPRTGGTGGRRQPSRLTNTLPV
jgi:hypothetical protein